MTEPPAKPDPAEQPEAPISPPEVAGQAAEQQGPAANEPTLLRRLASGTFWQTLTQLLPPVFNLSLTPFIIHGLGAGIYAIFLLTAVVQQFVASVDGGVGPSARRFLGIYAGRGDRASMTSLVVTLVAIIGAGSTVLVSILVLLAPQIMAFFPGTAEDPEGATFLMRVMILVVALAQVRGIFTQVLWVSNRFRTPAIADLTGFFTYAVGMVLTVQQGWGLVGIGWTFVAQQVLITLIMVPAALPLLDRKAVRFVSRPVLKEFFHYSWKLQISGLLFVVASQGDAVFVGRLAAPQMTEFGTGANFANTLRWVPMSATTPIEANIVRAIGSAGPEVANLEASKIQRLWSRAIVGYVAVGAPAAGFGVNAWLHLGSPLPGQVAAVLFLAHSIGLLMIVQRFWLNGIGRSDLTLTYDVISTVANLTLTFPLILLYGVGGTITATLVAALLAAVYLTRVSQRRVPLPLPSPWSEIRWIDAILAAVASFGVTWAASHYLVGTFVPEGPLALLVIGGSAAPILAVYGVRVIGLARLRALAGRVFRRGRST